MKQQSKYGRRSFVRTGLAAASVGVAGVAQGQTTGPAAGDLAIVRFSAAAEQLAADLWSQMADQLATSADNSAALRDIDPLLPQIVFEIARNERSHADFLNAYLQSIGGQRVQFDQFRTLRSFSTPGAALCTAAGANTNVGGNNGGTAGPSTTSLNCIPTDNGAFNAAIPGAGAQGRLTNLTNVNLNTSYFTAFRSPLNPDLGAAFPQLTSTSPSMGLSLIASQPNQGGARLTAPQNAQAMLLFASMLEGMEAATYLSLATKISSAEILGTLGSLMPVEAMHYTALQTSLARLLGTTGVSTGQGGTGTGGTGTGGTGTGGTGTGTGTGGTGTGGTGTGGTGTGTGGTGTGGTGTGGTGTGTGGTGTGTGGSGSGSGGGSGDSVPANLAVAGDYLAFTFPGLTTQYGTGLQNATNVTIVPGRLINNLPFVAALRPRMAPNAGAMAQVRMMMDAGLLSGQDAGFVNQLMTLAQAADAAVRSSS